MILECFKAT